MRRRSLLTASAAALAGCARDGGTTTLRFWAMGRESEVVAELMPGFEREHPGVRVKVEQLPWTAAHEKLLTAFAGDATPDLAQVGNTWLPEMQALGALEPLEPWLARTPALAAGDYFDGIWATNAPGGQRVGLPWYVDTRLMFVRQDLLARAGIHEMPRDWDAWRATLAQLRRHGMDKPILLPTNESAPLLALALQQPGEVLRDGGRHGNFSGPGFRTALGFYLERFQRGEAPSVSEVQIGNLWQAFGRGYGREPGHPLPPYLKRENFAVMRDRIDRLDVLQINFIDHLAAQDDASLDRFVLLDAQDWMDDAALTRWWTEISRTARPGARVLFRTAAEPTLLPGRVPDAILWGWHYAEAESRRFTAADRSSIYGGFHVYTRRKPT